MVLWEESARDGAQVRTLMSAEFRPGVGTISTGTPFVHPRTFEPYDPQALPGISPRVLLTQLASERVVRSVAARLGFDLGREQTVTAPHWVKTRAYRRNQAVIPDEDLAGYLQGLTASA